MAEEKINFEAEPIAPFNNNNNNNGNNNNNNGNDKSREGQILDAMNNYRLGTTYFRLIPDNIYSAVNGTQKLRLYRRVDNALSCKIQLDENKYAKSYSIPSLEDFERGGTHLTTSQVALLTEIRRMVNDLVPVVNYDNKELYPEICKILNRCEYHKQIVFTYGKLLRYITEDKKEINLEENDHVRVFKFAKGKVGESDFITVFRDSMNNKNLASRGGSTAWQAGYFSRNVGEYNKIIACKVGRSKTGFKGYTLNLSFEQDDVPFEITEHDLEIAENLNERVFNITRFDDEKYEELNESLGKIHTLAKDAIEAEAAKAEERKEAKENKKTEQPEPKTTNNDMDEIPF